VANTLLQLRNDVRINLDEASAAFWTDAQLNRFISQAADEVWAEVRKVKQDYFLIGRGSTDGTVNIFGQPWDTSTMALQRGAPGLQLPPDFAELKSIRVITPGYEHIIFTAMDQAAPEWRYLDTLTENQTPTGFFFDVGGMSTLLTVPKSDTALDIFLLYISTSCMVDTFAQRIAVLTADTDQVELPVPLYLAVEAMATWRAQYMDRDPGADRWLDMANKTIARWMGGHRRQIQDPEMVMGVFE